MLSLSLSRCVPLSIPVDYSPKTRQKTTFLQHKCPERHLLASIGADSIQICLVLGAATNLEVMEIFQSRALRVYPLRGTILMEFMMSSPDTEKII
jgi:hypothetical protein